MPYAAARRRTHQRPRHGILRHRREAKRQALCRRCHPCPAGLDIALINKYYDLAQLGDKLAKAISVEKSGKTFVDYAKLRVGKEGVSEAEFGGRNAQLGEEQNRGLFGVRGRHGLLGRFCMRATDECRNSGYFGRREGSGGGV